jgi:hypothetical protein
LDPNPVEEAAEAVARREDEIREKEGFRRDPSP